jgi:anti-sigma regulatory factor (Ser/Thr protein kinase)
MLLPTPPNSVAIARHRLAEELLAVGVLDTAIRDAALVLSELLSNAIRHARPLHGSCLRVAWSVDGESIEVAVSDGGSPTRPRPAHASRSSLGGRGINIIEHLSSTWGVRDDDGMLTVWAILSARAHQPAQRARRSVAHVSSAASQRASEAPAGERYVRTAYPQ